MSEWDDLIPRPNSRFLRVKCRTCESEQIIFSHTTRKILCRTCYFKLFGRNYMSV